MTGADVDHEYEPTMNVELIEGTHRDVRYRGLYDRVMGQVLFGVYVEGDWSYVRTHEQPAHIEAQEMCEVWVEDRLAELDNEVYE